MKLILFLILSCAAMVACSKAMVHHDVISVEEQSRRPHPFDALEKGSPAVSAIKK